MSFKIKGLKEVQDKLKNISEEAEKLNNEKVPLTDVMTDFFISENTSFNNFNEFATASGFKVETQEEFDAIPKDEWNKFIVENTNFSNWQEMINSAGAIYARTKLGL